jgi:RNA polymerase sigma-70 factor (ECF subfamily)
MASHVDTSATRRDQADPGSEDVAAIAVSRAKHGDWTAFHYLYTRYADDIYRCVLGIVRDPHEAEDVTQTVFTKLMTSIERYEARDVPFGAWVAAVARNAAVDHLRRRRPVPCNEIWAGRECGEPARLERARCLKAALEQLPSEQREVLVLRHIAGLSPAEIAERLDKTEASVHGLHHRGRGALQAALQEFEVSPVTAVA